MTSVASRTPSTDHSVAVANQMHFTLATHRKLLRITGISALLLFAQMAFILRVLSPDIVTLQFCFTPEAFHRVLEAWQSVGVETYLRHFPFDFVFLTCYGVFGYLWATPARVDLSDTGAFRAVAKWLLPFAALFDLFENVIHLSMLANYAEMTPLSVAIAGTSSLMKWLLIVAFLIHLIVEFFKRRRQQ